jgi:PAS domain S-box-containing protein
MLVDDDPAIQKMENILIIDDEPQIRTVSERHLSAYGYRCETAPDAGSARRCLERKRFDLILCDINLPDESGLHLAGYVKTAFPGTAIVMISVIDDPGEAKLALDIGVFGYVVKPFTRNSLLINVENALQRNRLEVEKTAYLDKLESLVHKRTQSLNTQLLLLQNIIDAIPNPIFYKDSTGCLKGCNSAFESLAGTPRETIIGKTEAQIVPRAPSEFSSETDRWILANPGKLSYEFAMPDKNNCMHNFLLNKATYHDTAGKVAGLVGVMVDLTERKAAEESLRLSEEKFRRIVENICIGVSVISPAMEILWMNGQMAEWFPRIEIDDRPICYRSFNNPPRESPCDNCPTVDALKHGQRFETIISTPTPVGERRFRIIASPIHDKDGRVAAAVELVEDITEKLTLEREMHQAQKLESIGQLAAGIAHEINTPTQYIGDNTRFLQDAFADLMAVLNAHGQLLDAVKEGGTQQEEVHAVEKQVESVDLDYLRSEIPLAIEQALDGVSRVGRIVTSMRQFSHPGTDRKSPVDINQALEATITIARNEWKYVADLETDFDPDLPMVACLPGEINQMFLNLLVNAAQAIGEYTDDGRKGKGMIRVSTRRNGGSVRIRIADTGGGIPKAVQPRIFDPFFTTKPVGKGTGQGLAIAHAVIVEKHAGSIRFETYNDRGTTFFVDLPIGSGDPEESSDEA